MKTSVYMQMVHLVTIVLSVCLHHKYGNAGDEWEYDGEKGPDHWHLDFPHCGGVRQSPVSIQTAGAIVDSDRLVPFAMSGYDSMQNLKMHLENSGHTVQVDLEGEPISITLGGLKGVYLATQFHFHWGKDDKSGSEHDIDGTYFPMEMHIVHYNMKYKNFNEALDKEDGLAVLGFFFEVGKYNILFDHIIDHFSEITNKDDDTEIETFVLRGILPRNLDGYFRYNGSLTTPPCYESVIWSIFYETIEISENQLEAFRHMVHDNHANETNKYISDDYRPPQCLNHRKIYCSKPVVARKPANQDQHSTSGSATFVLMAALTLLKLMTDLLLLVC